MTRLTLVTSATALAMASYHAPSAFAEGLDPGSKEPRLISVSPTSATFPTPIVNVRRFGARGDGVTNDTDAFIASSDAITAAGGGTLLIPPGVYVVGRQQPLAGPSTPENNPTGGNPLYVPSPIIRITNCTRPVVIKGLGRRVRPKLKAADSLRYGSFDPVTGLRFDPAIQDLGRTPDGKLVPFWAAKDHQTNVYEHGMIFLENNASVAIRNLELDGNLSHLALGGFYAGLSLDGDPVAIVGGDRQCEGIGIFLLDNDAARIDNVYTHHHGLDGAFLEYDGLWTILRRNPGFRTPHLLNNVVSEYNGRVGLAWEGGVGLTVENSKFNHSGKAVNNGENAALASKPYSGLDIEIEDEAQDTVCRDGLFEHCEFIDNKSAGMLSSGANKSFKDEAGYARFEHCTFWGTRPAGIALFPQNKALVFEDCKIFGPSKGAWGDPDPDLANKFIRCHFEDKSHPLYGGSELDEPLISMWGDNVLFDQCDITANNREALFVYYDYNSDGSPLLRRTIFRNTTVTHKWVPAPDYRYRWHSTIRGRTLLENVIFKEQFPPRSTCPSPCSWYIYSGECDPGSAPLELRNVIVVGPKVGWGVGRYSSPTVPVTSCVTKGAPASPAPPVLGGLHLKIYTVRPFDGMATVSYSLPDQGPTRLAIYDVTGRLIAKLVDQDQNPGEHSVAWPGRDARGRRVASGVYLVRLESRAKVEARRLVLTR